MPFRVHVYFIYNFFFSFLLVRILKSCVCCFANCIHKHTYSQHDQVLNSIESDISFLCKKKKCLQFPFINFYWRSSSVGGYVNVFFNILDAFRSRDFPHGTKQIMLKLLHSLCVSRKVFRLVLHAIRFILQLIALVAIHFQCCRV